MKKSYEKPEVRKVKLIAEEAVLQVCKNDTAVGPVAAGGPCAQAGSIPCQEVGS